MSEDVAAATRVVADADVLAADLFVGGPAREALDHVRRHTWLTLLASAPLLDDAAAVVADLGDEQLAADWREQIEGLCESVDHPPGDHPALASAYRGDAGHLLTFEEELTSTATNSAMQPYANLSIRPPDAFARLFDPEGLYEHIHSEPYPGPDRDPRA